MEYYTSYVPRTDDLYDLYEPVGSVWSIPILMFQGRYIPDLHDLYGLYGLAHVAGWARYNLHDLGHEFLTWICTVQILHNVSWWQDMI